MGRTVKTGRQFLRSLYVWLLQASGLLWWAKFRVAQTGAVVLTFHRVLPDAEYEAAKCQHGMMVKAKTFEALLQYFQQHCQCVPLAKAVPQWVPEQVVNSRPRVALTFDDAGRTTSRLLYRSPEIISFHSPCSSARGSSILTKRFGLKRWLPCGAGQSARAERIC